MNKGPSEKDFSYAKGFIIKSAKKNKNGKKAFFSSFLDDKETFCGKQEFRYLILNLFQFDNIFPTAIFYSFLVLTFS